MSPKHSSLPGWGTYSGIRNGPILLPFSILPGQSPCSDGHWVSEHSQRSKHAKWGLANANCYLSTYDGDIIEGTHRSQGHSHFCTESFYPARFFFPGSCRTQSLLLTTTWWLLPGNSVSCDTEETMPALTWVCIFMVLLLHCAPNSMSRVGWLCLRSLCFQSRGRDVSPFIQNYAEICLEALQIMETI